MGVFFAEKTLELGGITAEHLRDLFGVESYEAFCEMLSRFIVDPYRVSGGEIALHFEHSGCEQTGRSPRTALDAPASATRVPCGWAAKPIHRRREEPRSLIGANAVPTGSPIMAGPAFDAQVSTAGMPETAATRAASILVTMPPVPTFDPVPPTCTLASASSTFGT